MQELVRDRSTTKSLKRESRETMGAPLTPEQIEGYLAGLAAKGRVPDTIENYRRGMRRLYRDLPDGEKVIRVVSTEACPSTSASCTTSRQAR